MVNDFGTVINPMLTAGQAHGGVVQGIGQALMERTVYDRRASRHRLLHGLRPAARLGCADFSIENHSGAVQDQPLGVKGCGEAGCAGALPSVMNAVVDALSE
jgi:Aerobic-type carbon monoxide dehydrogenase, large subunit CoxL/CutL homologs